MRFRATPSANRPYCGLKWQEHGGEVTWEADKQTNRQADKQTSRRGSELHLGSVFVFVAFVAFVPISVVVRAIPIVPIVPAYADLPRCSLHNGWYLG